ncbi:MAG: radical SAM protein [Candidatus Electrothrix sp. AW2]|nr:radical SAM protein [Candidatus Electrothrix gigas]
MKKVALIYPSDFSSDKSLPLGIGYLASYLLKQNDDIAISVLDTGICTQQEYTSFIKEKYDVVGFSVSTRAYREGISIAKKIRANHPNVPIVFGGPHVSVMLEKVLLDSSLIDYGIYGEGELTLNELLNVILNAEDRNKDIITAELLAIEGLIFRDNEKVIVNDPRPFIEDVDNIPFPAFHLFPMERYPGKYPMITSRGCPFACVYCASSMIWKRKWRPRSPENIIEEIKYIIKNYTPRPIDFHDDGFNMSLDRVNNFCDQLIQHKIRIPWGARGFRADIIDQQTAEKMRQAGSSHVAIGIESADNDMLKRMKKNEDIEKIDRGITLLHSAGIDVIGQFMIGNPSETLETVKTSIDFVKKSKLSKAIFGTAVPFPGTELWHYVENEGHFLLGKDCTKYEDIPAHERIIFETDEFTKEDRRKAIELVMEAGYMPQAAERYGNKGEFKKKLRSIWFRFLYGVLPLTVSYRIYFLLRKLKRIHGA